MPDDLRKPRRRQKRADQTEARLLAATVSVLVDKGYAGATTTAVCKRADCSRGQLLHHFPNREALLVAALSHVLSNRVAAFVAAVDEPMTPDAFVQSLWRQWHSDAYIAWLELAVASRTNAALRGPLQAAMLRFEDLIQSAFHALVPAADLPPTLHEQLPFLLFATFNGLAVAQSYEPQGREQPRVQAVQNLAKSAFPALVGGGGSHE